MIKFVVPGEPLGQPRHRSRIAKKADGSQFIANYTPKAAVKRQRLVGLMASSAMRGMLPYDGPVSCKIVCYFGLPKSAERKRNPPDETWHESKPDCDNLAKLVLDGCNGIVFKDDAKVANLVILKRRCAQGDSPRTEVLFQGIGDD